MENQLDFKLYEEYFEKLNTDYQLKKGEKNSIEKNIEDKLQQIELKEKELDKLEKVDILLKETSEFARKESKYQIEKLVSNCLSLIFGDKLEFKIKFNQSRNKNSAEFYLKEKDVEYEYSIVDSRGGGLVDIISLALRLSFLLKLSPKIEGPLILDEPAKHVSSDYIFNVSDFIKKISEEFDIQIILISHNEHISSIGDKVYRIDKYNLISKIEDIK